MSADLSGNGFLAYGDLNERAAQRAQPNVTELPKRVQRDLLHSAINNLFDVPVFHPAYEPSLTILREFMARQLPALKQTHDVPTDNTNTVGTK